MVNCKDCSDERCGWYGTNFQRDACAGYQKHIVTNFEKYTKSAKDLAYLLAQISHNHRDDEDLFEDWLNKEWMSLE